uniref:Kinesin-like protein n=1 Tax=Panagrolaimus sp. PS1159 TaxID=55785 RepID=A0AC35FZX9_9BILA
MGPRPFLSPSLKVEEKASTMGYFDFDQCQTTDELEEHSLQLHKHFFEAHLDIKDKLIQNLELVIDEQEGRIHELRNLFKAETGRCSPITLSERKMLRGISHLSVDFGTLSDENFELKEELEKAKLENRRLEIRLNSTVTNFSQLPLLMDSCSQTESNSSSEEIYCLGGLRRKNSFDNIKTKIFDGDETEVEYLNDGEDTEEEERDDISQTTASSVIPCDPLGSSFVDRSPARSKSSISNDSIILEENAILKQKIQNLQDQISQYENELFQLRQSSQLTITNLLQRYEEEVNLRKSLHDSLVQLRGNIRVFCRIRPNIKSLPPAIQYDPLDCDAITVGADSGQRKFTFDRIFDESSDQIDLYSEVEPLVLSCLDGVNVCIFAYGQTGSGKTYTMDGPQINPGIGQRALIQIFQELEKRKNQIEFTINVSLIEIYNEKIKDLLDPTNQKLELHLEKDGRQRISKLSKHSVDSVEKVQIILSKGRKNRSVAATALNDQSSRSHAITMIEIAMIDKANNSVSIGKLNLIDLAGSERVAKSQVSGQQLKEAQCINKSLSELGNVVSALRRKQQHVPFRNCLLTRILEDSLDGNSKTLMIVQVASEKPSIQETLSSLNFAEKISNVTRRVPKSAIKKS